ncbi:hypothetical protein A2870_04700 [Candidatus Curtissbacteria bacterium RIFCSPHIGHO2_01_FULL_41_11]|uniref:Uncharacterized protein n=1 Tax=Candidatus Curtissbacteria bacterium RIFCSPHIGHO2_01_FULL_41_11 TaxID=1797711 RepID=A0A1F5G777_9BACT|nr:MAG: hypothetical protein A2870_04700 [Candidatus Curtissbacteria bacterium RIFCSPHIGHO2_01_FULL_41_11]
MKEFLASIRQKVGWPEQKVGWPTRVEQPADSTAATKSVEAYYRTVANDIPVSQRPEFALDPQKSEVRITTRI